ncbi:caspase family protein [Puniceibacterium sediminis]|uniref:Caspase domain-containing protein n=1 Tax=Puniceibacterium sediminis TaxID=1608407 RepID=A0A238Z207_9RHOB|nr:caspase family protein [Puniceibacterium sediminis]SNR76874.1 Caspase domain-containing protein [Puniceibacterium sediminis]
MNFSICIAIGAAHYKDSSISSLPGATVDAKNFYGAATNKEFGTCDETLSKLLLDPTKEDVRVAVADAVSNPTVTSLTLFFAGHGAETKSGYFLTCHDADASRLALSGLSLTDVFQLLNERSGLHTNIVLDACQAGGVAIDLSAVTKSFEVGVAGGSSVSILAMSSRGEAAQEALDGSGGFGTQALLRVMKGEVDTGKNVAELTLADIAQAIDVSENAQTPSFWSFNLQGTSAFCKNAFALQFRAAEVYETPEIFSEVQVELSQPHREQLWQCYLDFHKSLDTRRIYDVLSTVLSDEEYGDSAPAILSGLFVSFLYRSHTSDDAFAPVLLTSVFSMIASEKLQNLQLSTHFVKVLSEELERTLTELADDLDSDDLFLVRGGGGYSEFFTLPQRISSLAAWSLVAARISVLAGVDPTDSSETSRRILAALSRDYIESFNLMSERQAAAISVVCALGKDFDDCWVEMFIGCLYNSYLENSGKIARVDLPADKAFPFLMQRTSTEKADFQEFCERPSEALFALFAAFWHLGLLEIVRYDIADLDDAVLGTFIPESYSAFSEKVIRDGTNVHFKIGFEVFTISDLSDFFENELMPRAVAASEDLSDIEKAVATCATLVFPDRVPWHLFARVSESVT